MVLFLALYRIFPQFFSRDGIRESEGTIGTEPTQGDTQLTVTLLDKVNVKFYVKKGEGEGGMP